MDPIHPILPVTDRIPPVTVVPRIERAKRHPHDDDADGGARRRRHDAEEPELIEDDEDGDDGRPHVDISA